MQRDDFDEINNILQNSAYATSFIKDYILRFRFADLALRSNENANYSMPWLLDTTESMVEKYTDDADKIIEKYEDRVKEICSSSNIKEKCENEDMMSLKVDLDNAKKKYFKLIIDQYNNIESYGKNSGMASEYMLYDMYSEYINSEEFVYDESNPYVVELYYHITTFMQIRERIENGNRNTNSLISKFQDLCQKTLKKYWKHSEYDYYGTMRELFKYDFYMVSNDEEKASIHDTEKTTLYSKVLNYLKTITNYEAPESNEEKYKNSTLSEMMKGYEKKETGKEKKNRKLETNLKKIALLFVQLRKIESEIDQDYVSEYIPEDIATYLNGTETSGLQAYITAYMAAMESQNNSGNESELSAIISEIQKYTDPLLRITRNEARILRDLSDRAINWYLTNEENIRSGKIFEKILEVNWPNPKKIYKDGIKHDFYFLEEPKTISEQLDDPLMNGTKPSMVDEDGYEYTEDSRKTRMDIFTFGYWIKYCTMATLVNCMLPMYWSTGLIVAGVPVKLPIIYLPITIVNGRVSIVIGLGICGICPLPMLLFVNFGETDGSMIPVLNTLVDTLKKLPSLTMKMGELPIKGIIKGLIEAQDDKINRLESEKRSLDMQIQNLKSGVKIDQSVLKALKRKRGDSTTFSQKKKGS